MEGKSYQTQEFNVFEYEIDEIFRRYKFDVEPGNRLIDSKSPKTPLSMTSSIEDNLESLNKSTFKLISSPVKNDTTEFILPFLSPQQLGALKALINTYNINHEDNILPEWNGKEIKDSMLNKKSYDFINNMYNFNWLDCKYYELRYSGEYAYNLNDFTKYYINLGYNFKFAVEKYRESKKAIFCLNVKNKGGCDRIGCIFYHPKCHFNLNCQIINCNCKHDDKRENNQKVGAPLCKYNQNCKNINCPYKHDFICPYGSNCIKLKNGVCHGTH